MNVDFLAGGVAGIVLSTIVDCIMRALLNEKVLPPKFREGSQAYLVGCGGRTTKVTVHQYIGLHRGDHRYLIKAPSGDLYEISEETLRTIKGVDINA